MGEVIRLDIPVPDDMPLDPDRILEANRGKFQELVLLGYDQDGKITVCATHGSREVLWIMERAKLFLDARIGGRTMTMLELLKRAAEVIGATAVVYGAAVGFIVAFGGHVPPWATVVEAQSIEETIKNFQKTQAQQDKEIQANVDLLTLERLRDDAKEADQKADINPHDRGAKADAWFAQKRLEIFFHAHPSLASAMEH